MLPDLGDLDNNNNNTMLIEGLDQGPTGPTAKHQGGLNSTFGSGEKIGKVMEQW